VLQSSRHLLSLINDVLDLSKVEAGKLELQPTDVNLKLVLNHSLTMIAEKAIKNNIKLSTDIEEIPETITADQRKLKQILYNLLSNAVKFTPDGGSILLKADLVDSSSLRSDSDQEEPSEQTDPQKFILASVADTGIGIRQEYLQHIFEPFKQVDSSFNRKYQGTGLGLSLVKKLVELHGGKVWVESEGEGKGCIFSFTIPA
jgi:signal transduction histidine kinase